MVSGVDVGDTAVFELQPANRRQMIERIYVVLNSFIFEFPDIRTSIALGFPLQTF